MRQTDSCHKMVVVINRTLLIGVGFRAYQSLSRYVPQKSLPVAQAKQCLNAHTSSPYTRLLSVWRGCACGHARDGK